jgi:tetratricopeptide (TPR) repeat protein
MSYKGKQRAVFQAQEAGHLGAAEALAVLRALHCSDDLDSHRRKTQEDLEDLLGVEPHLRDRKIDRALVRYRSPFLASGLLEEALDLTATDPEEAHALLQSALAVLNRIPASSHANEVRHVATCTLATLIKQQGAIRQAERLFEQVHSYVESPDLVDPVAKAHLCWLEGSFRKDLFQLPRSESLLGKSVLLYSVFDRYREASRARLTLGLTLFYSDRPLAAIDETLAALALLDPRFDEQLCLMGRFNVTLYEAESGRPKQAAQRLKADLATYQRACSSWPSLALQIHWLAGKIHRELGSWEEAMTHFLRAREGFSKSGNRFDALLVCLDLSISYLKLGHHREVLELSQAMIHSYAADGLHTEAMAALRLFDEAARANTINLPMVRNIYRFLYFSRLNPHLQCEEVLGKKT